MDLSLRQETLSLALRDPFRIARSEHGEGTRITTVIVEVRDDRFPGVVGVGEGYPDLFYGETPETMAAVFPLLVSSIGTVEPGARGLVEAADRMAGAIRGHGAARCALDIALHDLNGKAVGQPVHAFLGLSADLPPTDFTIGIDEPAVVAERAARAADFPALKIKCGGPSDVAT
ncbi:MAG: dipeptide epimerase, partial [Candidatus Limnocylindrales bacterium]